MIYDKIILLFRDDIKHPSAQKVIIINHNPIKETKMFCQSRLRYNELYKIKGINNKLIPIQTIDEDKNLDKTMYLVGIGWVSKNSIVPDLYSSDHVFIVNAGIMKMRIIGCW